jgi:hypothetical protein
MLTMVLPFPPQAVVSFVFLGFLTVRSFLPLLVSPQPWKHTYANLDLHGCVPSHPADRLRVSSDVSLSFAIALTSASLLLVLVLFAIQK